MIQRGTHRMSLRALVVDDELGNPTAEGRAIRCLVQELQGRSIEVVEAASAEDGTSVVHSDSAIHAVLIDWTLGEDDDHKKAPVVPQVPALAQRQDPDLPHGRTRPGHRHSHRRDGDGRRVRVDARGHRSVRRRPRAGVHPPLHRYDDAAAGRGDDAVQSGSRVLLAHAWPRGWHGLSQIAGRARVLRLLRRKPAAIRPVDQRRQSRLAARSFGADGRTRALCGAGVRRATAPTA